MGAIVGHGYGSGTGMDTFTLRVVSTTWIPVTNLEALLPTDSLFMLVNKTNVSFSFLSLKVCSDDMLPLR
jgi:hypothetical protein